MTRRKMLAGFTLLELLVVISIIGILVAVGAVAFTTAQKKGRDARRHGDMQAVQAAFEQYFAENGQYNGVSCSNMGGAISGGWDSLKDPKTGDPYLCPGSELSTTSYCVCAKLEDTTSGNSGATCNFGAATTHFCVENLQ